MSFFEPPPLEAQPTPPRLEPQPDWFGAPANVLPGVIPVRLVVATTETVAVSVTDLEAHPTGLSFVLRAFWRSADVRRVQRHHLWFAPGGQSGDDVLRFGVELADGSKATNLDLRPAFEGASPAGPVLTAGSGGAGDRDFHSSFWLWPLPPPGRFAFVCEWPAEEIPLTRAELGTEHICDAAARAEQLWDAPTVSPFGGSVTEYARLE